MTTMERKRRMRKANVTQLKDLDVDRVDGVRDPATGRRFLLFKSKDAQARFHKINVRNAAAALGLSPDDGVVRKALGKVNVESLALRGETEDIPSGDRRSGVSFANVLLGGGAVRKSLPPSDEVRSYGIKADATGHETQPVDTVAMDEEDSRMGRSLRSWAGRVEETRQVDPGRKSYARDSFLEPTGGMSQPPVQGYESRGASWEWPRSMNFATRTGGHGLATPENFDAPPPGVVRMGDGFVLKSKTGERYVVNKAEVRRRAPGFWAGIACDAPTPAEVEHAALLAGDRKALALIAQKRAQARGNGATETFSKARRGGARFV
jgi:hypothetical protein